MSNLLIPVVFFCALVPGEPQDCNGQTALYKHTLSPVTMKDGIEIEITTPSLCLEAGMVDAAKELKDFQEQHPNEKLDFRVKCERLEQPT